MQHDGVLRTGDNLFNLSLERSTRTLQVNKITRIKKAREKAGGRLISNKQLLSRFPYTQHA
jgi:hypothetical protein